MAKLYMKIRPKSHASSGKSFTQINLKIDVNLIREYTVLGPLTLTGDLANFFTSYATTEYETKYE